MQKFTPANLGHCLHEGKVYRMKIHIISSTKEKKGKRSMCYCDICPFHRLQYEIVYEFLIVLRCYKKRYPSSHRRGDPSEWPLMI